MRRPLSALLALLLVLPALLLCTREAEATYISPTWVSTGAVASNAAAISPGMPANIRTHDILFLFCETTGTDLKIANHAGGSWEQVAEHTVSSLTTRIEVFWDRYNGSQTAPTTDDSGNHQLCRMIAFRGAETVGTPYEGVTVSTDNVSDTSGTITAGSSTIANTTVIVGAAGHLPDATGTAEHSSLTNANLGTLTERIDNSVTAGDGGALMVGHGTWASTGSWGDTTYTKANNAEKVMVSLALKGKDLGAATRAQTASLDDTAADPQSTIALTFGSNVTSGNLMVVVVSWGGSDSTPTANDTILSSWAEAGTHCWDGAGSRGIAIFYATAASSAANTVTIDFGTSLSDRRIIGVEYSGTKILDVQASNCTQTGVATVFDAYTSTFVTTTAANAVLVGGITGSAAARTPGNGYSEVAELATALQYQDAVMVSTGLVESTWTIGSAISYHGKIAAFKESSGAAEVPKRSLMGVGQ